MALRSNFLRFGFSSRTRRHASRKFWSNHDENRQFVNPFFRFFSPQMLADFARRELENDVETSPNAGQANTPEGWLWCREKILLPARVGL
jgi:hypothetical protein